jgi:uncharacterized membrane protein
MRQDDLNEAEWRNPANWTCRGPLGLYSSKRDTRLLVPKAMPAMGWTLNFAHPACTSLLVAIVVLPVILAVAKRAFFS